MPTNNVAEDNITVSTQVIDSLDMGLHTKVQEMLAPVYESFPSLSYMILDIPLANLIAASFIFFLFILLRRFFTKIAIVFLEQLSKKTSNKYDDKVISALKEPFSFFFIIIGLHLFFLLIYKETEFVKLVLETLFVYTIFWAILSVVEALREVMYSVTAKFSRELSKEMGDFILAIIKILILGVGLGSILKVWGINVTALVASLGIGGLAFALAAKDTAANLFGSFSLLADKSIRIGEWIKVNGVEGTVEKIGMRTTKIRSFQKSLITVPNHIVANNPIENFSRRGVRRIKMRIGITYDTDSKTVKSIVNEIRIMLKNHQYISQKETLLVNFESFGDSALNIFIYTFTDTANWAKFLDIQEDVHINIMKIVEDNGSAFAFPSQSIYVEQTPAT